MALYVVGTVLFTYPLIENFSKPFSEVGDYLLVTYGLSWQIHALLNNPLEMFHANVMHPTAYSLAVATPLNTSQLIFFLPAKLLTGDSIFAINVVYFGNILATACSVYIVLRFCGVECRPAFVAGWAFGFAFGKLHQNFQFPFFWLVWTSYFWYGFLATYNRSLIIGAAVSFVAMSLGSFYLMYMGLISLLAVTVIYHLKVTNLLQRSFITTTVSVALCVAIVLIPFGLPYFHVNKKYGLERPLGEAIQYSADPLDSYILPNNGSILYENFQMGKTYRPWPGEEEIFNATAGVIKRLAGDSFLGTRKNDPLSYKKFHDIWSAGWEERRLFPGYGVLLLALLGIFGKTTPCTRIPRLLSLSLFAISVALSCGPVLVLLGHLTYLPLPYFLLYYVVPGLQGMRATARFGYVALLALAGLAAIGWSVLERRFEKCGGNYNQKLLWFGVLGAWLMLFTAENLPAKRQVYDRPVDPPSVYAWLANSDIKDGIIEVPTFKGTMRKSDSVYGARRITYRLREYMYMYYGTYHWKSIYNGFGAFPGPHQFEIRDAIESLPDKQAVETLNNHGISTIIAHTYWFEAEDIEFWSRPELDEVLDEIVTVGGAKVYRLKVDPRAENKS